ncbi:response regulator [Geomonas sp. Red32]|uniref:response regulator n=1 Tax=Geomonas sp. Red32 TaxID=2912856 RepID=UPI00202CBF45|nr:response regulator [Geomonas sp. Red32]MCM0081510.1 response regulator [Geomonas sp. Red32]
MSLLPYDISGITLLYVEDEADARTMVSKMLVLNYPKLKLLSAENGAVGLELYREHSPDLVVTDINMPVMDGIRMAREIKAINPEAIIMAVTAHSDTSYLLSAIEIGIHYYILKPVNYEELFSVTDKILEQIVLKQVVADVNLRIVESQMQLAMAQRIAHLGSWQRDLGDGSMNWSDELYRIFGFEPGALTASYQAFLDMFVPDDREAIKQAIREAVENREPVAPHFCRIVRPDGTQRVLRVEAEVLLDGTGIPSMMYGTSHDVTELKQAEERIRLLTGDLERQVIQRTSLLQATVRELENFSYVVSHDLRAPVARLEGFCQALVEDCQGCSNRSCTQYAQRAQQVVRQVKHIIDAFNNLSHYARCSMVIDEVDLSAVARAIATAFQQSEPERRVEFAINEGVAVKGDRRLLQIALEHLLGNAWKFTSRRDAARIEFGQMNEGEGRVFFVRDNGAGFDMKYVNKLFKPFQTIHSPGEYTWDGTAIGLATVHSIILRHGGRIWAEGEVDRGATFYFTLSPNPEPGSFLEDVSSL